MLDIRKFLAASSAVILLLSGCASVTNKQDIGYDDDLASQTAVYSWSAKGKMFFSCAHDEAGFYWRFVKSEGILKNDKGQEMGRLNPDLSITGRDGKEIKLSAFKTNSKNTSRNLKNLLYKVTSSQNKGMFAGMLFVERRNAKGGLPITQCSAIQNQQLLRVPFEARYIFWR